MAQPSDNAIPIRSELADDAEMQELIQMFVEELPDRISEFERAWNDLNFAELRRFAHSMKGAAPGYGYTPLGEAAAALEAAVKTGCDAEKLRAELDTLIDICGRIRA